MKLKTRSTKHLHAVSEGAEKFTAFALPTEREQSPERPPGGNGEFSVFRPINITK